MWKRTSEGKLCKDFFFRSKSFHTTVIRLTWSMFTLKMTNFPRYRRSLIKNYPKKFLVYPLSTFTLTINFGRRIVSKWNKKFLFMFENLISKSMFLIITSINLQLNKTYHNMCLECDMESLLFVFCLDFWFSSVKEGDMRDKTGLLVNFTPTNSYF